MNTPFGADKRVLPWRRFLHCWGRGLAAVGLGPDACRAAAMAPAPGSVPLSLPESMPESVSVSAPVPEVRDAIGPASGDGVLSDAPRPVGRRAAAGVLLSALLPGAVPAQPSLAAPAGVALPAARTQGRVSLEFALAERRSLRDFAEGPLSVAETGQLLWSAQGLRGEGDRRTAPSAGASYPLVLYLFVGRIDGLAAGVYRYQPQGHRLVAVAGGDTRLAWSAAARGQAWVGNAPVLVLIAAEPSRTVARYGARAERYVAIEAGAAAQNLLLQAVALGLGGTLVGAFDEAALRAAVPLPVAEQPLAVVAVGRPR